MLRTPETIPEVRFRHKRFSRPYGDKIEWRTAILKYTGFLTDDKLLVLKWRRVKNVLGEWD
jgi:hypothetical protein